MNEEELKVIKELKEEINKPFKTEEDIFNSFILFNVKSAKIILNLIDKQQKKLDNSISKDKICEMIDKIIDQSCTYDDMYIIALEDFKEIIEKGDIE